MVRLKIVARVIPEDAYLAHVESSIRPVIYPGEKKFAIVVKEPGTWKVETLATAIENKYLSLYKTKLGSIKYLKDDTNDCDLDPGDTLVDALIDEGKAQVDNSDQNVTISVVQEQENVLQNGIKFWNSTPAVFNTPPRPSGIQFNVPRFEDLESPLGKRKRVASAGDDDDRERNMHESVQRRKRSNRALQRTRLSRPSLASESQPAQLASPTPSSNTNPTIPPPEAAHNDSSQAPPAASQPLTWHLNQARNMQLSLKDLNRVMIADSASNSTMNSPAVETEKKSFHQVARPLFGAEDDGSDDSSNESSDVEPAAKTRANGGEKAVSSREERGLHVPDPTIRDASDEDEDNDSD